MLGMWFHASVVYPAIMGFYDDKLKHKKNYCPCSLKCEPEKEENRWTVEEAIEYNKKAWIESHGGKTPDEIAQMEEAEAKKRGSVHDFAAGVS